MTDQPKWRIHAYIGDRDPTYGGTFIYRDLSGVYGFEAETVDPLDCDGKLFNIYRYSLDQLKRINVFDEEGAANYGTTYVVPINYDASWRHPPSAYREWFMDSLQDIADCTGQERIKMVDDLCSNDPKRRAWVYLAIGEYHGFENLDSYPLTKLTAGEVRRRYRSELKSKTVRGW
jgi:hypothetical protein